MSPELEDLVWTLFEKSIEVLRDVPSIRDPISDETERAVDAYVLALVEGRKPGRLTKRIARGLFPRLQYARAFGGLLEGMLDQQLRLGDSAATGAKLLEWIFPTFWHEQGRQMWFEGKLGGRDAVAPESGQQEGQG